MVNGCYFTYQMYTDKAFYSSIQPGETNTQNIYDVCLYGTGTGDFKNAFSTNEKAAMQRFESIFNGIDAYNTYNTDYAQQTTPLTEPIAMTNFKTKLTNNAAFTSNDFWLVSSEHRYTTVLAELNTEVVCTANVWVMTVAQCAGGTTVWTTADTETYLNTAAVCIGIQEFINAGYTLSTRYAGTCCAASAAAAQTKATNLNNFMTDYQTLITNMKGTTGVAGNGLDSTTGANSLSKDLMTTMAAQAAHYVNIKATMPKFLGMVEAFSGGIMGFMNCTIIRKDLVIFSEAICHRFTYYMTWQSIFFSFMGPLMTLMSVCMCASMRCPLKDEEQLKKDQYADNNPEYNNLDNKNGQNNDVNIQLAVQADPNFAKGY